MEKAAPTHQYCIIYDDEPSDEGLEPDYSFSCIWDDDELDDVAGAAAEDYHSEHDGWEASWPVRFAIFNMAGELLGKCEVEREYSPTFSAREVK